MFIDDHISNGQVWSATLECLISSFINMFIYWPGQCWEVLGWYEQRIHYLTHKVVCCNSLGTNKADQNKILHKRNEYINRFSQRNAGPGSPCRTWNIVPCHAFIGPNGRLLFRPKLALDNKALNHIWMIVSCKVFRN